MTIYKNPTADFAVELFAENQGGFLRGFVDKNNDLYIWDAQYHSHNEGARHLGMDDSEPRDDFRLHTPEEALVVVQAHSDQRIDDKYGWGATPPKSIVILTGSGISAESGIPTFRDKDGLWCNNNVEDVATPEGFERNPSLVHDFCNLRRAHLKEVKPNAAHKALAELALKWEGKVSIITQNIDDLHERAGSINGSGQGYKLIHMHGELNKARCIDSGEVVDWLGDITVDTICPCCHTPGRLRPHIVWFNEMPLHMEPIYEILHSCDIFISIGTSGNVFPAAGFVEYVRGQGKAHTVEINMEPSLGESMFQEKIYGPATQTVPDYVARVLAGEVFEYVDEEVLI